MKKRKIQREAPRVVVGMGGALQEELELYQGVSAYARGLGWQLIPLRDRFEARLRSLIQNQAVDGVIAPLISGTWLEGVARPWPHLVNVGSQSSLSGLCQVCVSAREVGRVAGEHLGSLGCDAYAYVGIPGSRTCREYEEGFRAALGGKNVHTVFRNQAPGYLQEEVRGWPLGTAVLCYSDFHARLVVREVEKLGRSVPDDVAVCGVGNQELDQLASSTGISSVPLPHELVGREAAACLRDLLEGREEAGRLVELSPGQVWVRASTQLERRDDPVVSRALQYLRRHVASTEVSMDALAGQCAVSRRGLEQKFKAHVGTAPYAHLLQLRLELAKSLLRETRLQVREVGERVGYPDPQRFSAFFKRHEGSSPGRWRQT